MSEHPTITMSDDKLSCEATAILLRIPSTICRVNKTNNFTILNNQLLRSPNLSLKAIGLMSKVLSLPKEWDYSIAGLTAICIEKESAIKSALAELRKWGYLKITKLMPNQTKSGRIEYVYDFYEYSEIDASDAAQILIEAALIGSGKDGSFGYVKQLAGDVNGDGTINASDAAVVLIYAAAVGAGNTTARLSDFLK